MERLFETLNRSLAGGFALALVASLVWGGLSILLSPCHLASLPLLVGYISARTPAATGRPARRALLIATLFALGVLVTIALIGLATAAAGRLLGDLGGWGNYLVALVFFAVGLHLLEVLPLPLDRLSFAGGPAGGAARERWGGLLLGLVFGLALGPCAFAFMAPVLGLVLRLGAEHWLRGVLLLAAYGLGHGAVLVLVGSSVGLAQRVLDWNAESRGARWLRRGCGVLVLFGGLYLIYAA